MLYLCLSGMEPFYGMNEQEVRAANRRAEFGFNLPAWESISDEAKDLVSGSWILGEDGAGQA